MHGDIFRAKGDEPDDFPDVELQHRQPGSKILCGSCSMLSIRQGTGYWSVKVSRLLDSSTGDVFEVSGGYEAYINAAVDQS